MKVDADVTDFAPVDRATDSKALDASDVDTELTGRREESGATARPPPGPGGRYSLRAETPERTCAIVCVLHPLLFDGVVLAKIIGRGGWVDGLVRVRFLSLVA